jgi:hypothetical protein
VPDLPSSLAALVGLESEFVFQPPQMHDDINVSSLTRSASADLDDLSTQFKAFLAKQGKDEKYDNLRLPLQVATLISPIFLLLEVLIHKSTIFSQRYRLMMVSILTPHAHVKRKKLQIKQYRVADCYSVFQSSWQRTPKISCPPGNCDLAANLQHSMWKGRGV